MANFRIHNMSSIRDIFALIKNNALVILALLPQAFYASSTTKHQRGQFANDRLTLTRLYQNVIPLPWIPGSGRQPLKNQVSHSSSLGSGHSLLVSLVTMLMLDDFWPGDQ